MRVRLVYEVITDIEDKEKALTTAVESLLEALDTENLGDIVAAFKEVSFVRKYNKKQVEE